jgi:hypothetical protein
VSTEINPTGGSGIAATEVFIEILLTGIGAGASIGIGVASLLNIPKSALGSYLSSPPVIAFGFSLAYVLGITVDRLADRALEPWSDSLRQVYFSDEKKYAAARLHVSSVPWISEQAAYARSRMRVCRGWIVISPFLTVSSLLWVWRNPPNHAAVAYVTVSLLGSLFSLGVTFGWRSIVKSSYKQLSAQYEVARSAVPSASP